MAFPKARHAVLEIWLIKIEISNRAIQFKDTYHQATVDIKFKMWAQISRKLFQGPICSINWFYRLRGYSTYFYCHI